MTDLTQAAFTIDAISKIRPLLEQGKPVNVSGRQADLNGIPVSALSAAVYVLATEGYRVYFLKLRTSERIITPKDMTQLYLFSHLDEIVKIEG